MNDIKKSLRIALSMRITQADSYVEKRDSISHDWIMKLDEWGMTPLLIPNSLKEPTSYLDRLEPDLLILTGGDDLGKTPERDQAEIALLSHAIEAGYPVLGICRGLQLINRQFGGRASPIKNHVGTRHTIEIHNSLSSIYGDHIEVNSYHDQSMVHDDIGDGLISAGIDKAGMVEAVVHIVKPIAGIMWHPERDTTTNNDMFLLERLVSEGAFWK